jgi:hypothetical protein
MSGHLHVPTALPLGKEPPWYPLDRRLGGPQCRSGRGGEEKNSQTLQKVKGNLSLSLSTNRLRRVEGGGKAPHIFQLNTR